jgi:hypothetical protein
MQCAIAWFQTKKDELTDTVKSIQIANAIMKKS